MINNIRMDIAESSASYIAVKNEPMDNTFLDAGVVASSGENFTSGDNEEVLPDTSLKTKQMETDYDSSIQDMIEKEKMGKISLALLTGHTRLDITKQDLSQAQTSQKHSDANKSISQFYSSQNLNSMCLPKLIRMVPEAATENETHEKLSFIKTEEGQLQCLKCLCLVEDIQTHGMNCVKKLDEENTCMNGETYVQYGKVDINLFDRSLPLDESQQRISSEVKTESIDIGSECSSFSLEAAEIPIDSFPCPTIKIEAVEVNDENDTPDLSVHKGLMECQNCKLVFNNRLSYLDHKVHTCDNLQSDHMPDKVAVGINDTSNTEVEGRNIKSGTLNGGTSGSFTCSCPNCKTIFNDFVSLNIHRKTCKRQQIGTVMKDLNVRSMTCSVCKMKFRSKDELSKHVVSIHLQETDFNEEVNFSQKKRRLEALEPVKLGQNQMTERKARRKVSHSDAVKSTRKKKMSKEIDEMKQNKTSRASEEETNEAHHCLFDGCSESFNKVQALQEHLKVMHFHELKNVWKPRASGKGKNETHPCPIEGCSRAFYKEQALQEHLQIIHYHECKNDGCGLFFETKEELKQHIQDVHIIMSRDCPEYKQYTCSLCFRVFSYLHNVKQHLTIDHDKPDNNNLYILEKMMLCKVCNGLIDSAIYKGHYIQCQKQNFISAVWNNPNVLYNEVNQVYECVSEVIPGEVIDSLKNFQRPAIKEKSNGSIVNRMECSESENMTKNSSDITKSSFFLCKICNRKFLKKSPLYAHLIQMHSIMNILPSSDNCTKEMAYFISELKQYANEIVEQKSKIYFSCKFKDCEQKFRSEVTLNEHCYNEHREKECRFCNYQYTCASDYLSHLNKHSRPVHVPGEEIRRKCELCDFTYLKTEDYKTHLISHYFELQFKDVSTIESGNQFYCNFKGCGVVCKNIPDLVVHESKYHNPNYSVDSSKLSQPKWSVVNISTRTNNCDREHAKELVVSEMENSGNENVTEMGNDVEVIATWEKKSEEKREQPKSDKIDINESRTCHLCHLELESKDRLFSHLTVNHDMVLHGCRWEKCGFAFLTADGLKTHVKTHIDSFQQKRCKFCEYQCSESEIHQHVLLKHIITKDLNKSEFTKTLDLDNNLLPYKCEVEGCIKAFLYHRDFKQHMEDKDHVFLCPVKECSAYFKTQSGFLSHGLNEHKTENCEPTKKEEDFMTTSSGFKIEIVDDSKF